MGKTRISVFDYVSSARFISDYLRERTAANPSYSIRAFSSICGICHSQLSRIMGGKRNISDKAAEKLITALNLEGEEARYFRKLVLVQKNLPPHSMVELMDELADIRKGTGKQVEPFQYEFFSYWIHPVVRELIDLKNKIHSAKEISEKLLPRVPTRDVKESLRLLESLQLIKRESDGSLIVTDRFISTGDSWDGNEITSFQLQMLRLAIEALNTIEKEERDFSTVTMTLSGPSFEKIRKMLGEFRHAVMKVADNESDPNRVFQLNLQFFPVTKTVDRKCEL